MKKISIAFISLFAVACAGAQKAALFKPFKVDVSAGYAMPQGSGSKGGVVVVTEPKYAVLDQLALGIRFEFAVMARGYGTGSSASKDLELKGSGSYLFTTDYYFSKSYSFRPFIGAGLGVYSLAAGTTANGGSISDDVDSKFGQMARVGFEAGHFRLGAEYNFVPDTELTNFLGSTTTKTISKNSYLGIKIGVVIGGGSKK